MREKVLVLAGTTATGKSALALRLAAALSGEIINTDTFQAYSDVPRVTASPHPRDIQKVRHHLYSFVSPLTSPLNPSEFTRLQVEACKDVLSRGKTPIFVGSSTIPVQFLVRGSVQPVDISREEVIKKEADLRALGSWEAALQGLTPSEAAFAATVSPNNYRTLARTLLKLQKTSKTMLELGKRTPGLADLYDCRPLFVTAHRLAVMERIDKRCERMLRSNIIKEVAVLLRDGISPAHPLTRAIGVQDTIALFEKSLDGRLFYASLNTHLREYMGNFQASTRSFARRQTVYFKKQPEFLWLYAQRGAAEVFRDITRLWHADREEFDKHVGLNAGLHAFTADSKNHKDYISEKMSEETLLLLSRYLKEVHQKEYNMPQAMRAFLTARHATYPFDEDIPAY